MQNYGFNLNMCSLSILCLGKPWISRQLSAQNHYFKIWFQPMFENYEIDEIKICSLKL